MEETEALKARVQELEAALAEEESKTLRAATLGQALLGQKSELEAQLRGAQQESSMLRERLEGVLRQEEADSSREAAAEEAARGAAGEAESGAALQEAEMKIQYLGQQLEDAMRANERTVAELREKEAAMQRLQQVEAKLASSAEESAQLRAANDALTSQLRQAQAAAEQAARVANENEKMMRAEIEQLQAQVAEAGQASSANEKAQEREAALKQQVAELGQELAEASDKLSELMATKKQMEEAVTSLVKQNQAARREYEEQSDFLEQARSTIAKLRAEKEDADGAPGATGAESGANNSLLAELESEFDTRVKAQEESKKARENEIKVEGAPDNCQEYFLTAQTAVKIGLAIKYPHKSDEVFRVKGIDLYYKCLNSGVPFHQWHIWIARTLHGLLKGSAKPAAITKRGAPSSPRGSGAESANSNVGGSSSSSRSNNNNNNNNGGGNDKRMSVEKVAAGTKTWFSTFFKK